MKNNHMAITVSILDRDYQIACSSDEQNSLRESAEYLDRKMREIRDRGNVIGIDRIAVMAALNIAHEFLLLKPLQEEHHSIAAQISAMKRTVSEVIANSEIKQQELI